MEFRELGHCCVGLEWYSFSEIDDNDEYDENCCFNDFNHYSKCFYDYLPKSVDWDLGVEHASKYKFIVAYVSEEQIYTRKMLLDVFKFEEVEVHEGVGKSISIFHGSGKKLRTGYEKLVKKFESKKETQRVK